MSHTSIRSLIENYAQQRGLIVPEDVRNRLISDENRATGHTTVLEVRPQDAPADTLGTIREVNAVNIFRRSGLPANLMGRALLGRLADETFLEVVIREDRDPETGFASQFTFLVPLRMWETSRLERGSVAHAILKDHQITVGKHVWMAKQIERAVQVRRTSQ